MRGKRTLLVILAASMSAGGVCAQVPQPAARVNVQLPTVSLVSVPTTVWVPDRGRVLLGGQSRSAAAENRFGFQPAAHAKAASGDNVDASATIIDFSEFEEQVSWRVAQRLYQQGKIDAAITELKGLQSRTANPQLQRLAEARLESLGLEGIRRFEALAGLPPSPVNTRAMQKVLSEYGALIQSGDRVRRLRVREQHPAVAEEIAGVQANAWLSKAQAAQRSHKYEVAKVFYRMAARLKGTKASLIAQRCLADLSALRQREVSHSSESPMADQPISRWLELARAYRDIDPSKASGYYRRALAELPSLAVDAVSLRREAEAVFRRIEQSDDE